MNLRLNTLAKMVDGNSRIADIGTDHAYLPIQLVKQGKIDFAIASDIGRGPLANAQKDIMAAGLDQRIETRLGNGLDTIKPTDHIDIVVIAGMGGKLITKILNKAWLEGKKFSTLILEPNIGEEGLRSWLMIHNYCIIQEKLIYEAGHSYELIKAIKQDTINLLTEKELLFGPKILESKNQVFYQKWQRQLEYKQKLVQNLKKANQPNWQRINLLNYQIKLIKEELND